MIMQRAAMTAGLLAAAGALGGCADSYGRYGHNYGYARSYYGNGYGYYPAWYDGYYGNIYDGYWDRGGTFYYRTHDRDRWRRDEGRHFRRGDRPDGNWNRWEHRGRHHDHDGDRDGD